jgi:DNA-binding SARP family transcriptional activator/tetratricopeptide (TPR) repeat protein
MLRLRLCGQVTAESDDGVLALPTSDRARALIGWLALHPGPHPRAVVAARLWPDTTDGNARANLRTAIWSLRQAWGPTGDDVLDGTRNTIGLRRDRVSVDALDDPPLEGELLPGVEDDWAEAARAEHRERQLDRFAALAAAAADAGRLTEAARWARRRCDLVPLDEGAHRDLLQVLEAAGDRAGAVLATREFTARLRTELGVRPSPATRAAQSQLTGATHDAPRPQLFGRTNEIARLRTAWREAAAGAGQVVVLTGEAGIGKTSLLADLVFQVAAAGGRSAVGTGSDVGGETPFGAWLEVVRALVDTVAPVPSTAGWPVELCRLSPELGTRLGRKDAPVAVAAPELERLRVFESVLRLVEWAGVDRPALIAVDDAHRADRASLRLTAHIGRRLARLPVLLVLTRRDRPARPELDALLADLTSRGPRVTDLDVGPIEDRAVAALASSLSTLADPDLRRIVVAADGNPLLAVESVRAMAAGDTSPPPNLRTAVRATVGRLSDPGQDLARLLAVAGRPLGRAELDALGVADLAAAEHDAIDGGLLVRAAGRLGYRHSLLRDVVCADLVDPAAQHDRLARALDRADRAGIARHLTAAGRPREAAQQWRAAADYARSVGALDEAAEFLVRATECAPDDGQLWLDLQESLAWLGRREEMEQAWARAIALLDAADLPAAWCRRGLQFRTVVCHPSASLAAYRSAHDLIDETTTADVQARVLVGLAWGSATAGDAALVDDLLAATTALLPTQVDQAIAADIGEIRVQQLIRQGRFAECADVARGWFHRSGMRADRGYAMWINTACALACVGDYEQALEFADQAIAATRGVFVLLPACLAARAHLLARLGRHEEAAETVGQQRAAAERLDSPTLAATAAHDAGLVALAAGRYADAAELLGVALATGAEVSRPAAAMARAEALARAGDPDAAQEQVRSAVLEPTGPADQPWALVPRMTTIQALIATARGDDALAARRLDEAEHQWQGLVATAAAQTAESFLANLVDLGRPPVVGLIEPERELIALRELRATLVAAKPTVVR